VKIPRQDSDWAFYKHHFTAHILVDYIWTPFSFTIPPFNPTPSHLSILLHPTFQSYSIPPFNPTPSHLSILLHPIFQSYSIPHFQSYSIPPFNPTPSHLSILLHPIFQSYTIPHFQLYSIPPFNPTPSHLSILHYPIFQSYTIQLFNLYERQKRYFPLVPLVLRKLVRVCRFVCNLTIRGALVLGPAHMLNVF